MKQKTTLLLLVFFISLFSFGQRIKSRNNGHYGKYRIESQLEHLNLAENRFGKGPIIIKSKGTFENSMVTSSQEIASSTIIKYALDSEIYQTWDETLNQLVNHSKTEYTYDNQGNLTKLSVAHWDGSLWETGWKIEYSYDTNGNILEEIESYLLEGQWYPDWKYEYTYDANGNLILEMEYGWDESYWRNLWKTEYNIDANGLLTQILEYSWNGSQWINDSKTKCTYDSSRNLIQEIEIHWNNWQNQWVNFDKKEYAYDINRNIIEYIDYNWSSNSNQWNPNYKNEFTYNANGNLTQIMEYDWNTIQWINQSKNEYTYDTNDNLVQSNFYEWDGSQWNNSGKSEMAYNNSYSFSDLILPPIYTQYDIFKMLFNHMLTNANAYSWDTSLQDWVTTNAFDFSYSEMEILSVIENNMGNLRIYPNPVSNTLTIQSDNVPIERVEIYSVLGKKIKAIYSDFENIHTGDLSQGIYLLRIYSENSSIVKKLIKN